jgi:hypothetical protein
MKSVSKLYRIIGEALGCIKFLIYIGFAKHECLWLQFADKGIYTRAAKVVNF